MREELKGIIQEIIEDEFSGVVSSTDLLTTEDVKANASVSARKIVSILSQAEVKRW